MGREGHMRRREFITLLGGAAVAWPLAARAQRVAKPVVGFLHQAAAENFGSFVAAFAKGLGESGYIEGQNVAIEYRWAEGHYDRLPILAADLTRRPVAAICAAYLPAALAAKAATATIPIVFVVGSDPVEAGLVATLNRPAGNVTGVSQFTNELIAKRLELLRELVPGVALIGVLMNTDNPNVDINTRDLQAAARATGQQILIVGASSKRGFDAAFTTQAEGWRALHQSRRLLPEPPRRNRHFVRAPCNSRDLFDARVCRSRRSGQLRSESAVGVAAGGRLYGANSQGRETR
jgi:putative ABC transport system substrate-binding protein